MGEMGEGTPTGELTFIQRRGAEPRSAPNTYRESHEALQKTIGTRLPSYSTKGVTSRGGASVTGKDRRGADRVSLFRILIGGEMEPGCGVTQRKRLWDCALWSQRQSRAAEDEAPPRGVHHGASPALVS